MLGLIDRWFSQPTVSQDYHRGDYIVLGLILAVGVFLRFWGLGNVGLHGDEETMAMPAMAILETGQPLLPSGMYYSRALLNIYMMSGSVWLFGESEWAFRLPSAVVGSLTGLAAFFMGRRFLDPQFNLAFVATVTFLPSMIVVSQTARMYVFFVTCLIWYAACLFRWERDQRNSSLVMALLAWMLALHFQVLAIFAAPLFLFPGLSRRSWPLLLKGLGTFVVGFLAFDYYGRWYRSKYPQPEERLPRLEESGSQLPLDVLLSANAWLFAASVALVAVVGLVLLVKVLRRSGWHKAAPVASVFLGLTAMVFLQFHIGSILLLVGVIFWLRSPDLSRAWLAAFIVLAWVIAMADLGILAKTDLYPGRKLVGAVVGMPSIWPVFRFLQYSPAAGLIYGLALLVAVRRFIQGQRLPIHFLFFVMAVWLPLFLIGYFSWYIPPRYAQGQLGCFLLCVVAGTVYAVHELGVLRNGKHWSPSRALIMAVLVLFIVNPMALARTVNPGYDNYPDHKGAAEFIKNLNLPADALLIAEDVLQQTYYLGAVDYSLRPITDAQGFSVLRDGRLVDQYTGSPVIGTGEELDAVLDTSAGREVYIIGSGENFVDGKRLLRGRGIAEVLDSDRLEVVYEGRDGLTQVWRMRQP
jgi:hypothetical protein